MRENGLFETCAAANITYCLEVCTPEGYRKRPAGLGSPIIRIMPCHLLEALIVLPLVTLLTRLVTVGTQDQDVPEVFPVAASIVDGEELLVGLHGQEYLRDLQLPLLFKRGASIPPPGKLTVQTINITAVLISWSYSYDLPSPIYFYVQCSVDGDPFVNISGLILFGGGTTSYVYHGLRFQAFYQFQVIASFGGESSEPSSPSNAFINGVTAPSGPPTNIRAIKVSSLEVDLVWKRPDFPIFDPFLYTLYWGTARNDLEQSDIIGDVTSTTISNLHPNTTYFFGLVAMLSGFPSILSEVVNATTSLPTLGQVSIVELKSSQSWVWLQWTTPPPSPYPVVADQYTVTCSDGVRLYCQVMVPGQVQSVTITGLVPGTTYEFQVGYTSGGFPGRLSEPSKVSTLQGPYCYLCKPLSSSTLLVEWENPPVVNEVLTLSELVGNALTTLATIPIQGNGSYVVGGLRPFTQHHFSVGVSSSSSSCPLEDCTTIQQAPSGPPRNVSVAITNWSSVELMWKPPMTVDQNGIITAYMVEVLQVDSGTGASDAPKLLTAHRVQALNVTQQWVEVTGLQPFSAYSFVVAAGTIAGFGPGSDPVAVSAQELAPYLMVDVGLKASVRTGTSPLSCCLVSVTWHGGIVFPDRVLIPQTVKVLSYLLRYSDDDGSNGTVCVAGSTMEADLGPDVLRPGTTYIISLCVEGLYGSEQLNLTTHSVNTTCPDCSGSQVQAWMVTVASLVGILVVVSVTAVPVAIYCWARRQWKRRSLTHSYLMDDHICSEDTPPNGTDQRVVVGESNEASPSTSDNTSVASDDELAEPLLGRQHTLNLPVLMGGVHESSASDGLNNLDYQMHNILLGTRYAPEGCSSSSSNSSASTSDTTSN